MSSIKNYKFLRGTFTNHIKRFSATLCNRCYGPHYPMGRDGNPWHHNGKIHSLMSSKKDISEMIKVYIDDIEHGLFHGLMTALVAKLSGSRDSYEDLLASCALHDFLKTNGVEQELHDKNLKEFFPKLLPETFTHADPPDENKSLVIADRLELQRYDDYRSWVDGRLKETLDKMKNKEQLTIFYSKLRPALKYFYKNRNSIFLRHGLENPEAKHWIKGNYPPPNSYLSLAEGYPIEIDRIPFAKNSNTTNRQKDNCSNHDGAANWNQIKGFITFEDFLSHDGQILDSKKRDHLYASSNIPIKGWIFVHHFDGRISEIEEILKNDGLFLVPQETLSEFFSLVKLFETRLAVLNTKKL